MKKLKIIAALFLLSSCSRSGITQEKTVVSEVDLITVQHEGIITKYKVYLLSQAGDLDPFFYSNKQYNVGDTVYFSTKP